MCRRELKRAETESTRNSAIITDYKDVSVMLLNTLNCLNFSN